MLEGWKTPLTSALLPDQATVRKQLEIEAPTDASVPGQMNNRNQSNRSIVSSPPAAKRGSRLLM